MRKHVDVVYRQAVEEILKTGTRKPNRTGVDTISTFNINYEIDLRDGFPLLTTKNISWKNIVAEMVWFLSGQTDISILHKHKCKFWDAWADKDGKVPSAYGNFWRGFPVPGGVINGKPTEIDFNDQIQFIVNELKHNPMSRRLVVSAWAPGNAQTSKLPPCHCLFIFNVQLDKDNKPILCCHLTQRSCDIALGVPYNIASYALLTHIISNIVDIPVGIFAHTLVDAHAYTKKADGSMEEYDHIPGLIEQMARDPRALPRLTIRDKLTIEDLNNLPHFTTEGLLDLFKLDGYDPWPAINFKVAV